METTIHKYDLLARFFEYPRTEHREELVEARQQLSSNYPKATEDLLAFEAEVQDMDHSGFEELFTRTFDLNPQCCPEIGWHLFGERYDRGSFLVWMRDQLRSFGLSEDGELPDHLFHVLRTLGRMEDRGCQTVRNPRRRSCAEDHDQQSGGKEEPLQSSLHRRASRAHR